MTEWVWKEHHRDSLVELTDVNGRKFWIKSSAIGRWMLAPDVNRSSMNHEGVEFGGHTPAHTVIYGRSGERIASVDGDISAELAKVCGFQKGGV